MARLLSFKKSDFTPTARSGKMETRPLPPDGDHIAVVAEIGEPFNRKSDGQTVMAVKLDIANSDYQMLYYINCNHDGTFANDWRGIGKWHAFCEALNLKEGDYNDTAFIGCALMITVMTSGKYKNIKKLWSCSETEQEKAIQWMASRGY